MNIACALAFRCMARGRRLGDDKNQPREKKKVVFHISGPLCVYYATEVCCKVSSEGQNNEGCTFRVTRLEFRISAPINVKIQR
jgi:hypothetical protein